jgi:acetoin utilization protein AcuB
MLARMADEATRVQDVMTAEPMVVSSDTTVGEAYATMKRGGFRHLPVCDDGKVVGVISTNDIGRLGVAVAEVRQKPVSAAMARELVTIGPDEPIETAAAKMALHKVNCLPVMVADELVGIVTSYDLLDALARRIRTGR